MIRRPPRSTLFPTRRSSDLSPAHVPSLRERTSRPADLPRRATSSRDRKSTRLNSSHTVISYAVFCLKKKKKNKKHKKRKRSTNETPLMVDKAPGSTSSQHNH